MFHTNYGEFKIPFYHGFEEMKSPYCQGEILKKKLSIFRISINIFLIPVGVATVGFTASIIILSLPLFALALLVSRLPFLDSGGRSLEAVAGD